MDEKLPRLLLPQDVALWLGLPTNRILRMARRGEMPCVVVPPDEIRFDPAALAAWLKGSQPKEVGVVHAK